jgi:uncharacterized surface protein with fasciclin (FAS1) repeats
MSTEIKSGMVKTVEGSSVTVKNAMGKVMVDQANVVQADIAADNGVIHAIDTVLVPTSIAQSNVGTDPKKN